MGDIADFINDERGDEWSSGDEKLETIPVHKLVAETEKAWLVRLEEGEKFRDVWFPKSRCTLAKNEKSIEAPTWLLDSKGIV